MRQNARKLMKIQVVLFGSLLLMVCSLSCDSGIQESPCGKFCAGKEGIANPAAVYCEALGYKYEVLKTEAGETGFCIFPDGSECKAWDFLDGKCGQEWSYCERTGGRIITTSDGCSISQECAICILPNGEKCYEWDYCNGECSRR